MKCRWRTGSSRSRVAACRSPLAAAGWSCQVLSVCWRSRGCSATPMGLSRARASRQPVWRSYEHSICFQLLKHVGTERTTFLQINAPLGSLKPDEGPRGLSSCEAGGFIPLSLPHLPKASKANATPAALLEPGGTCARHPHVPHSCVVAITSSSHPAPGMIKPCWHLPSASTEPGLPWQR